MERKGRTGMVAILKAPARFALGEVEIARIKGLALDSQQLASFVGNGGAALIRAFCHPLGGLTLVFEGGVLLANCATCGEAIVAFQLA